MNLTVYVPKDLEEPLRERAQASAMSPSLFVQSILREALASDPQRFSDAFAALAGSWEDERGADEIVSDIAEHRRSARRKSLR